MKKLYFGWRALSPATEDGAAVPPLMENPERILSAPAPGERAAGADGAGGAAVPPLMENPERILSAPAPGERAAGADGAGGAAVPRSDETPQPEGELFPAAEDTGDSVLSSAPGEGARLDEARQALQKANRRLLRAMVMEAAPAAGLSGRGAAAALRLAAPGAFGEEPDEARVHKALADFAAQWPEFAVKAAPAPFAAGTGSQPMRQDVLKDVLGVL